MQKWIAIGNITKDIELRQTPTGKNVVNFTIAVNRSSDRETTDFIDCIAWNKLAETIEKYCNKGDKVCVIGEIQQRKYQAKDGTNRYVTEALINEIQFLSSKKKDTNEEQPSGVYDADDVSDDDLPF